MSKKSTSGTEKQEDVYKFVRTNYASRKVLLYQNNFEVKRKTTEIGDRIQNFGISISVEDFLSPLKHIVAPKSTLTPKYNVLISSVDDI